MEHFLKHLSRITWDQVVLILGKLGTVLVDRRFLASIGTILFMTFGIPEGKYTEEITQIGTLILTLTNVLMWTVRPPSGLKHKELVDTDNLIKTANAVNNLYQK